jgi:hypothetical protein
MAKELPYFKFEPAEYLTKDISFCSISAQGLFINICCYYWQRNCDLTKEQLLKRLNYNDELNELIKEGVIDIENNKIFIKFLDNQLIDVSEKSKTNSINGRKGGRPKKNQIETEIKPNENPNENPIETESKGIREDKIKEENINTRKLKFADKLKPYLGTYTKEMLNDFYLYWTEHGDNDKKIRFEKEKTFGIKQRLERWSKNNFNKQQEVIQDDYMNNVMKQLNLNK